MTMVYDTKTGRFRPMRDDESADPMPWLAPVEPPSNVELWQRRRCVSFIFDGKIMEALG